MNKRDNFGNTALMHVIKSQRPFYAITEAADLLCAQNVDLNTQNYDGETIIMYCAQKGHLNLIKKLEERGQCNFDLEDFNGWTAYKHAEHYGQEETAAYLKTKT